MGIITKISPLYNGLVEIDFHTFVNTDHFVRLCNNLGISDSYTKAYNEVAKKSNTQDIWGSFLGRFDNRELLALILNSLYEDFYDRFASIVSAGLVNYFRHTNYVKGIDDILKDLQALGLGEDDGKQVIDAFSNLDNNILLKVRLLIDNLIGRSTNGYSNDLQYSDIRIFLLKQPSVRKLLPDYVISSQTLSDFWQYIKPLMGSYKEREKYIRTSFFDLLAILESTNSIITAAIEISEIYVLEVWTKASQRMKVDPEGAITSARTLLESVCKHILDELDQTYADDLDLPGLYKLTSRILNLAPDQHTEQVFKQITQGVTSIVIGLGSIRNKISDAHAINQKRVRPSHRHAALAVNLSGSLSQFLLQCFEAKQR